LFDITTISGLLLISVVDDRFDCLQNGFFVLLTYRADPGRQPLISASGFGGGNGAVFAARRSDIFFDNVFADID
jgi:hypothetical protein